MYGKTTSNAINKILQFVCDNVDHHEACLHTSPRLTLEHGIGMCGPTSILTCALLNAINVQSRVISLATHVVCEFRFRGRWCLGDTDFFTSPMINGGHYLTRQQATNKDNLIKLHIRDFYLKRYHSHDEALTIYTMMMEEQPFKHYFIKERLYTTCALVRQLLYFPVRKIKNDKLSQNVR